MSAYSFEPPVNFMALPEENSRYETSQIVILPVPYEISTSYRGGTRLGPAAILEASRQIELYDREFGGEAVLDWGVHTLLPLARELRSPECAVESIAAAVADIAKTGKLPVVLGGEHSVSIGVARGLHRALGGDFVTVQLDAHADLREEYEETPFSHACAARQISELSPVIQVGIRSLDVTEAEFIRQCPDRVTTFFVEEVIADASFSARLADLVRGRRVYLTIDVDVLDPSIMPSTGTPEPGGLLWNQTLDILRAVCRESRIIGLDCVELAPTPGLHAPDFTAAKLVYKAMGYALQGRARLL